MEPAIKARLSPTNQALFESVDDFLRWTAQIANFGAFVTYYLETGGKGMPIRQYQAYRSEAERPVLEEMLKKTLCTDGRTLFEVMQEKGRKKSP